MRPDRPSEAETVEPETEEAEGPEEEGTEARSAEDADPEPEIVVRLRDELATLNDRHLRLAAEFENYRKRTRSELASSGTRAQAALVGTLLEVLDDFQRVTGLDPEEVPADGVLEGVRMIEQKLHRILGEAGVVMVDPEGDAFDPDTMEAVMKVATESPEEDELVAQVLQRGVVFRGHLVRPARVAVLKVD